MISIKLVGNFHRPHIIMMVGNNGQIRLHSENYANRSNGIRAMRTLVEKLGHYANVSTWDETVHPVDALRQILAKDISAGKKDRLIGMYMTHNKYTSEQMVRWIRQAEK